MKSVYADSTVTLYESDAVEMLASLDAGSVNLAFLDPPYYKVKSKLWWDNQWETEADFLAWMGQVCQGVKRALAPNGSLYLCASPQMAWGVEGVVRERLNVLNVVRWYKDAGWHKKADVLALRSYLEPWEAIVVAEHQDYATSERGDVDGLSISVFEPIRAYLDSERRRAGVNFEQVRQMVGCAPGSGLPSHWFTRSQWMMPTAKNYVKLQIGFNEDNPGEYLRREYEYLRREYEYLRRSFFLTKDRPSTDLWTYDPVQPDNSKHETAKPLPMLLDIIRTSSRPGDLVLDCFLGGGTTLAAAAILGRRFIGGDIQAHWIKASLARLKEARGEWGLRVKREMTAKSPQPNANGERQLDLFQTIEEALP